MEDKTEELFDRAFLFLYKEALENIGYSRDSKLKVVKEPKSSRSKRYIQEQHRQYAGE